MSSGVSNLVSTADLHALVDGFIDPERRANALRHLAGCGPDRARVDAWQAQNTLLRTAFAGIEREPIPVALDLVATPRLHCVAANDSIRSAEAPHPGGEALRRGRRLGALAAALLAALAAAGLWAALPHPSASSVIVSSEMSDEAKPLDASRRHIRLPAAYIPDLAADGFRFAGAEIDAASPEAIAFRYTGAAAEQIVMRIAPDAARADTRGAPLRIGETYSWHRNRKVYAVTGSLRPGRLRALAIALQGSSALD